MHYYSQKQLAYGGGVRLSCSVVRVFVVWRRRVVVIINIIISVYDVIIPHPLSDVIIIIISVYDVMIPLSHVIMLLQLLFAVVIVVT